MYPNLELELFKHKISRKKLAQILGVSDATLRNKMSGRSEFTLLEFRKIAELFEVTLDYLAQAARETA